jgi:hypothetical protein
MITLIVDIKGVRSKASALALASSVERKGALVTGCSISRAVLHW